jgi:hypothetical protein
MWMRKKQVLEVFGLFAEIREIAHKEQRPFTSILREVLRTGIEAQRIDCAELHYREDLGWVILD